MGCMTSQRQTPVVGTLAPVRHSSRSTVLLVMSFSGSGLIEPSSTCGVGDRRQYRRAALAPTCAAGARRSYARRVAVSANLE